MRNILIADDDLETVTSLKESLAQFFHIDTASTGMEVLDWFQTKDYLGLIVDVDFKPGMNGLQIAARLRSKYKDLKILVFSATATSQEIRNKAVAIGAVFMVKPLDPADVLRIMN